MNPRNSMAANATLHCLTGCAVGEIASLMIGTAMGLDNAVTIAIAVGLAFLFGYALFTVVTGGNIDLQIFASLVGSRPTVD